MQIKILKNEQNNSSGEYFIEKQQTNKKHLKLKQFISLIFIREATKHSRCAKDIFVDNSASWDSWDCWRKIKEVIKYNKKCRETELTERY